MGTAVPSLENLIALSNLYNVTLEYLIHDELGLAECSQAVHVRIGSNRQRVPAFGYLISAILLLAFAAGGADASPQNSCRKEALDTMFNMGILTREQRNFFTASRR